MSIPGKTKALGFATILVALPLVLLPGGPRAQAAGTAGTPVFSNPLDFTHPYFPFEAGGEKVFAGKSGKDKITVVDSYLPDTRDFSWRGKTVTCRVLREREYANGEMVETSWNHFAQADDGSVYYFGEVVDVYEDGVVVSHEGSWLVGGAGADDPAGTLTTDDPGLFMPANPSVGDEFKPEDVPGGPQETDSIEKTRVKVRVPAEKFSDCILVREHSLPADEFETKWYAPGVGHVRTKAKGESLKLVARTFLYVTERKYQVEIDPADFTTTIDNPYMSWVPGTTFVLEGESEDGHQRNEVTVLHDTKEILGVTCVEVWDRVWVDDVLAEETFDRYAQDKDGNVWYFGEDSKEFNAKGKVVSTEGSWESGVDGALPGIIMPAHPRVGMTYRQEYLAGEAEDMARIGDFGETVTVPYGTFTNCMRVYEWSPTEPKVLEDKLYAPGVGVLREETLRGGEETMELVEIRTE